MHFSKELSLWYLENKRDLPWRKTKDPYHIWLSEIILQQTRVSQGLPYYLKFLNVFPTVFDLAQASEQEVLLQWQGLGYYSRARNMHEAAKYVVSELNGSFPSSYKELLQLKGVGDYTASAVASICAGEPVAVVDGNVFRVLSRVFGITTPIDTNQGKKEFRMLAQDLLDIQDPAGFNQALMEFGALTCTPRKPKCEVCPFQAKCRALEKDQIAVLPLKSRKQQVRRRHFNYLVFISEQQRTILSQRTGSDIWKGLYEFPLLETHSELSEAELVQENPWEDYHVKEIKSIGLYNSQPIIHKLSHQHIQTKFWIIHCKTLSGDGVAIKDLEKFPVPVLLQKFMERNVF